MEQLSQLSLQQGEAKKWNHVYSVVLLTKGGIWD